MMLNVYATRNKKSGQFGKPVFEVLDVKQLQESYTCSFLEASEEQKILLRELEVYKLGTYDTETGSIVAEQEFIFDLGSVDGKASKE